MDSWKDPSPIMLLGAKLRKLKEAVIQWQVDKKNKLHSELKDIEQKMTKSLRGVLHIFSHL
jgi:hypothetical protein